MGRGAEKKEKEGEKSAGADSAPPPALFPSKREETWIHRSKSLSRGSRPFITGAPRKLNTLHEWGMFAEDDRWLIRGI